MKVEKVIRKYKELSFDDKVLFNNSLLEVKFDEPIVNPRYNLGQYEDIILKQYGHDIAYFSIKINVHLQPILVKRNIRTIIQDIQDRQDSETLYILIRKSDFKTEFDNIPKKYDFIFLNDKMYVVDNVTTINNFWELKLIDKNI